MCSHSSDSEEDLFDSINLAEQRYQSEGYRQGFSVGASTSYADGFKTGVDQGAKVGSEVGFYKGFVSSVRVLMLNQQNQSKLKALDGLQELLDSFDVENIRNPTFIEELERIRGKFKQVCAVMNVTPQFGKKSTVDSF